MSIPSASPLTMTTSFDASIFAMDRACESPFGEAFLDPTIDTRGFGKGIFSVPLTYRIRGHILPRRR